MHPRPSKTEIHERFRTFRPHRNVYQPRAGDGPAILRSSSFTSLCGLLIRALSPNWAFARYLKRKTRTSHKRQQYPRLRVYRYRLLRFMGSSHHTFSCNCTFVRSLEKKKETNKTTQKAIKPFKAWLFAYPPCMVAFSGYSVSLLSTRSRGQIPAAPRPHFGEGEMQKRPCPVH